MIFSLHWMTVAICNILILQNVKMPVSLGYFRNQMSIFCYLLQPKDLLTPELLRFSHYPPLVNFVLVNSPSCPM